MEYYPICNVKYEVVLFYEIFITAPGSVQLSSNSREVFCKRG